MHAIGSSDYQIEETSNSDAGQDTSTLTAQATGFSKRDSHFFIFCWALRGVIQLSKCSNVPPFGACIGNFLSS